MTDLGSGADLDEDFDLVVNPTGDIATVAGLNDLEKDLAFQLAEALTPALGEIADQDTRRKLRNRAERVVRTDDRVRTASVARGGITSRSRNRIDISLTLTTISGEELTTVFTVEQ